MGQDFDPETIPNQAGKAYPLLFAWNRSPSKSGIEAGNEAGIEPGFEPGMGAAFAFCSLRA